MHISVFKLKPAIIKATRKRNKRRDDTDTDNTRQYVTSMITPTILNTYPISEDAQFNITAGQTGQIVSVNLNF